MAPKIRSVTEEGVFYHIRFREPNIFDEVRTPDWASNASGSISKGSRVRMGRKGDNWKVQSVLIKTGKFDESKARELAKRIVDKIEKD
ncbi:MAG: hypothetical protein ABEJ99_05085 [Candidatus Nanohaloarchaea archaeon]